MEKIVEAIGKELDWITNMYRQHSPQEHLDAILDDLKSDLKPWVEKLDAQIERGNDPQRGILQRQCEDFQHKCHRENCPCGCHTNKETVSI